MILNIIAQPLTICLVYYLSNNFNKYEIFIILVPLISSFIQIMLLVYSLYVGNKNNSIDYKLVCCKYSIYHIAISRIVFIFITLIPIVIINALFSIFFIVQNMMAFFGALLVSNLLINSFVYTFMICLLVLISEKMGRILYIFLGFFLAFVTLGISLISRPYLTNKTSNYLEYVSLMQDENQEKNSIFQTNKLISEDSKDILVFKNLTTSNLTVNDLINDINKKSVFYNNFIPSE